MIRGRNGGFDPCMSALPTVTAEEDVIDAHGEASVMEGESHSVAALGVGILQVLG